MAGQRRFNAHHWLNDNFPDTEFDGQKTDEIKCIVIPEPESDEKKLIQEENSPETKVSGFTLASERTQRFVRFAQ